MIFFLVLIIAPCLSNIGLVGQLKSPPIIISLHKRGLIFSGQHGDGHKIVQLDNHCLNRKR